MPEPFRLGWVRHAAQLLMQPGCVHGRHRHLSSTQACRYEEDILNAKKLGCNSFRFSLEWARLEPKQGQIDQDAVKRQAPHSPYVLCDLFRCQPA